MKSFNASMVRDYTRQRDAGRRLAIAPQCAPLPALLYRKMNLISNPLLITALMLAVSNLFMTFAWYGHLKNLSASPWYVAALASWGIALFEYLIHTQVRT